MNDWGCDAIESTLCDVTLLPNHQRIIVMSSVIIINGVIVFFYIFPSFFSMFVCHRAHNVTHLAKVCLL